MRKFSDVCEFRREPSRTANKPTIIIIFEKLKCPIYQRIIFLNFQFSLNHKLN